MTTGIVTLSYVGKYKINAIRAVRNTMGTNLKGSKELVEAGGFAVNANLGYAIFGRYVADAGDHRDKGEAALDWKVIPVELVEPVRPS